jgi:beta-phosphoglucomutase-like phosphatase (HAD superfamily)
VTSPAAATPGESGVIFDLDGTLIDSEPSWARGFSIGLCDVLAQRGHVVDDLHPEDMARFRGGRVPDTIGTLLRELGLDGVLDTAATRDVVQSVIDWVSEDVATHPVPIPEAVEAAQLLHQHDVPLAVASSSALPFIDAALDALGLDDAISLRLSAIDLPRGKPDPEVYRLTLDAMGLPASGVIAVEDSPVGVESAVRAGLRCVWFLPGTTPAERSDHVHRLMTTSTADDAFRTQVDALVSAVPTLSGVLLLDMLDAGD